MGPVYGFSERGWRQGKMWHAEDFSERELEIMKRRGLSGISMIGTEGNEGTGPVNDFSDVDWR
jgi:hypothetical protein